MQQKQYTYVRKSFYHEGKRYCVTGKTDREAQQKLRDLQKEVYSTGLKLDGSTTVKQWAKTWLETYVDTRDITAKSAQMYHDKLKAYILPEIGSMKLKDVKDTHLKRLLNNSNSSKSTAQKVRLTLQAMFRQARRSRLIAYDPAEDLELPKAPEGKRHSITDYERDHILRLAETHRAGLYVLLVYYCGLRPGECIALQWADVDLRNRLIHVRKALESGSRDSIKDPKSAAGVRSVPIPEKLLPKLVKPEDGDFKYVLLQPVGRKRHTESSLNDLWNNFKRCLDIQMGAEVYRNQIKRHCWEVDPLHESEENWEALVPYSLRHTYGTDLQRAGVPINVAKYLMGHSDISVTANIYTDTTPDVVTAAGSALDELHSTPKSAPVQLTMVQNPVTNETKAV